MIGPPNASCSGCSAAAAISAAEPARPGRGVVVEEAEEVGRGGRDRGVARGVEPARLAVGEVARAVLLGQRARLGVLRVVLDHDQLGAVLLGLGRGGGERDREIVAAPARRDQDRGGWGHPGELMGATTAASGARLRTTRKPAHGGEEQEQRDGQVGARRLGPAAFVATGLLSASVTALSTDLAGGSLFLAAGVRAGVAAGVLLGLRRRRGGRADAAGVAAGVLAVRLGVAACVARGRARRRGGRCARRRCGGRARRLRRRRCGAARLLARIDRRRDLAPSSSGARGPRQNGAARGGVRLRSAARAASASALYALAVAAERVDRGARRRPHRW